MLVVICMFPLMLTMAPASAQAFSPGGARRRVTIWRLSPVISYCIPEYLPFWVLDLFSFFTGCPQQFFENHGADGLIAIDAVTICMRNGSSILRFVGAPAGEVAA